MRRYLLVLDGDLHRDLVTAGEQSSPEPVRYLAARQEQEPCEVVVLTLVRTRQAQVPPFMALYIADKIGRYPAKSLPGHDVAAAEHRMDSGMTGTSDWRVLAACAASRLPSGRTRTPARKAPPPGIDPARRDVANH